MGFFKDIVHDANRTSEAIAGKLPNAETGQDAFGSAAVLQALFPEQNWSEQTGRQQESENTGHMTKPVNSPAPGARLAETTDIPEVPVNKDEAETAPPALHTGLYREPADNTGASPAVELPADENREQQPGGQLPMNQAGLPEHMLPPDNLPAAAIMAAPAVEIPEPAVQSRTVMENPPGSTDKGGVYSHGLPVNAVLPPSGSTDKGGILPGSLPVNPVLPPGGKQGAVYKTAAAIPGANPVALPDTHELLSAFMQETNHKTGLPENTLYPVPGAAVQQFPGNLQIANLMRSFMEPEQGSVKKKAAVQATAPGKETPRQQEQQHNPMEFFPVEYSNKPQHREQAQGRNRPAPVNVPEQAVHIGYVEVIIESTADKTGRVQEAKAKLPPAWPGQEASSLYLRRL